MSKEEYKDAIEVSVIFHEGQRMFAVPKQPAQQQEPTKAAELVDALIAKYSDKLYDSVGPHDAAKFEEDCKHLKQALAEQPAQQEPVTPTAVEMQNAAANLALMREMWGNADEPAAKVNDDGFIVETGLLLSPGTQLYTFPPAQRTWVGLSDLNIDELENEYMKSAQTAHQFLRAIEAKLKEKNT
jgi:hypothetical protein